MLDSLARSAYLIVFFIFTVLFIVLSLGMPFWGIDYSQIDLSANVDFAVINGMLTATTLVFGIIFFLVKEFEIDYYEKLYLIIFPVFYFIIGIRFYFIDAVTIETPTIQTLAWMTSVFFFMVLYPIALLIYIKLREY